LERASNGQDGGDQSVLGGLSEHVVHHLTVMTELHKQGRYDRMSEDYHKLTGETPTSMADFVKLHAAEFTRPNGRIRSTPSGGMVLH
jgi:hypothetical protein